MKLMKIYNLVGLGVIFLLILTFLFSGCVDYAEKYEKNETSLPISTITTTIIENFTTTMETTITTTSTTIPSINATTTTEKIKTFSCSDYCIKEGYDYGICRKTPAECRRYGVNEIYKPLGNKYCPKGTQYDACCCVLIIKEIITTTTIKKTEELNLTIPDENYKAKSNFAKGFENIRPIDTTIVFSDGILKFKLLNVAGVDIKIINISSEKCPKLDIENLDKIEIKNGGEVNLEVNCSKKMEKGDKFNFDMKITYSEIVGDIGEIYNTEQGNITVVVM